MIKHFLVWTGVLLFAVQLTAQESDTLNTDKPKAIRIKEDRVEIFTEMSTLDPQRSAILSAVLPGLGQIYNKQYWKVPLIYGGAIIIGHYIRYNDRLYGSLRSAWIAESDVDPSTNSPYIGVSRDVLELNASQLRRDRDYLMIIGAVFYLLNIVDAHVSAHLHEFQINDDLSMNIRPAIQPSGLISRSVGVSFSLNF